METFVILEIRIGLSQPYTVTPIIDTDAKSFKLIVWFTVNMMSSAHLMNVDDSPLPSSLKLMLAPSMETGEESTCSPGLRFRSTQS